MTRLGYIVTIVSIALMCILAEELYSDKYDDMDVQSILQNDKLRDQYYNCFMGTSPCVTAVAKFLKEVSADAFLTKCKRCTQKQKENMDMVVDWYTKNQPEKWEALVVKFIEDAKKKNAE